MAVDQVAMQLYSYMNNQPCGIFLFTMIGMWTGWKFALWGFLKLLGYTTEGNCLDYKGTLNDWAIMYFFSSVILL